jgi:tetratricopeptide (TPR) repeat protein
MEALGGVAWWQGDITGMRAPYQEALDLWRSLGDKAELANALYNFSFLYAVPAAPDATPTNPDPDGLGHAALEEARGLYHELGDDRGEASVLWGLGNLQYFSHAKTAGVPEFEVALEKFRRVGDRTMEAWSLHMLGGALLRTGQNDVSRDYLRHALRHFYEASDTAGITLALDDLSSQALADNEPERAARIWGAARNLTNTTGAGLAGIVDGWIDQEVRPNVRKALAPDELARLAREGAVMSLDETVAYALGVPVDEVHAPHIEAHPGL